VGVWGGGAGGRRGGGGGGVGASDCKGGKIIYFYICIYKCVVRSIFIR
jgi:hypothetical protein